MVAFSFNSLIIGQVVVTATGNNLYLNGAPLSGLLGSGALSGTSGYLQAQITNSGILLQNEINVLSGNLISTGQTIANWTGTTPTLYYGLSNPNSYSTSGNLTSASGALQTQLTNIENWTGLSTGYYYSGNNPNNFISSGNLTSSSGALQTQISNSGILIQNEITILSGNGGATGANLQGQINSLTGSLNSSGSNLQGLITSLSGALNNSGSNLQAEIISLSGHANTTFSQVSITGSPTVLAPLLTGAGAVVISLNGSTGYISGNTGAYANFLGNGAPITGQFAASGNLTLTGITLQNEITILNNQSGLFALISNTGTLAPTGATGQLTGQFYPLRSNPSGYLNSIPSGGTFSGTFYGNGSNLTGVAGPPFTVTAGTIIAECVDANFAIGGNGQPQMTNSQANPIFNVDSSSNPQIHGYSGFTTSADVINFTPSGQASVTALADGLQLKLTRTVGSAGPINIAGTSISPGSTALIGTTTITNSLATDGVTLICDSVQPTDGLGTGGVASPYLVWGGGGAWNIYALNTSPTSALNAAGNAYIRVMR